LHMVPAAAAKGRREKTAEKKKQGGRNARQLAEGANGRRVKNRLY
jgi:hypothetical protein